MRTLRSKDFRESALERGLYALRDEHGPCIVMRSHVDDLAVAIGRASNRAKAEMPYITGVLHMVRSKDNIYIAGRPWRSSKIGSLCGRLPLSLQ